jgi:hypothetical protein
MVVVVPVGEASMNCLASLSDPKHSGNSGPYLSVLNNDSEYGLSLDTRGRECDRVTSRSASRVATVLLVIDVPRSACTTRGTPCTAIRSLSFNEVIVELVMTCRSISRPASGRFAVNQWTHLTLTRRGSTTSAFSSANPERGISAHEPLEAHWCRPSARRAVRRWSTDVVDELLGE